MLWLVDSRSARSALSHEVCHRPGSTFDATFRKWLACRTISMISQVTACWAIGQAGDVSKHARAGTLIIDLALTYWLSLGHSATIYVVYDLGREKMNVVKKVKKC